MPVRLIVTVDRPEDLVPVWESLVGAFPGRPCGLELDEGGLDLVVDLRDADPDRPELVEEVELEEDPELVEELELEEAEEEAEPTEAPAPAPADRPTISQAVRSYFEAEDPGTVISASEVAQAISEEYGYGRPSVASELVMLAAAGVLARHDRGLYVLPEPPS